MIDIDILTQVTSQWNKSWWKVIITPDRNPESQKWQRNYLILLDCKSNINFSYQFESS